METNHGVQRWEDIVFENRNKSYGAYAIRKGYPDNVLRSGMFCIAVFATLIFLPGPSAKVITKVITCDLGPKLATIKQEDIILDRKSPPPPKSTSKGFAFTPTTENVWDDSTASTSTIPAMKGVVQDSTSTVEIDDVDADGIETPVTHDQPWVMGAEVMPSYEGGVSEMMKFLQKNLRYPSRASRSGIEGTVFVSFVVGRDGKLNYVEIMKGVNSDLNQEAIRVISLMSKWKSGMQDKMPVAVKMVLPIKFSIGK